MKSMKPFEMTARSAKAPKAIISKGTTIGATENGRLGTRASRSSLRVPVKPTPAASPRQSDLSTSEITESPAPGR